jgi:thiol-disulfide isomerase/thioredoxin
VFFSINKTLNCQIKLKSGFWLANLQLNESVLLPFKLEINKSKNKYNFTIHNAEEKITLISYKIVNDSIQLDFPNFHSFLRFKIKNKTDINGFWYNLNKNNNYKIPFSASKNINETNCINKEATELNGNWKTEFSPNTKNAEFAVGKFKTQFNNIMGTFLTETGDYRFLEGNICGNKFFLSCFDGSHAFLFTGEKNEHNEVLGEFYSGTHYKTTWKATKDENFKLRNPDSLTYLVKENDFSFNLKDLKGKNYVYPNENLKNKVIIIQIMGTWCPNCLDETKFLKEMYQKYNKDGLEIISVAYETPNEFEEQVQKVNLLKTRLNLDFIFLIGGQANKNLASEHFSMLNKIISFPTAIFINKKGEVVKIHTGFNGPGTKEIYETFKTETESFIQNLLK